MVLTMAQRLTSVQLKVDLRSVPSVQDPCDQRQTTPQAHTNPDALGCNGLNASQETGIMQKHAANSRSMQILLVMVHQCFVLQPHLLTGQRFKMQDHEASTILGRHLTVIAHTVCHCSRCLELQPLQQIQQHQGHVH